MISIHRNQKLLILGQIFLIIIAAHILAQTMSEIEAQRVTLPNGWQLTPVGKILPLGDLPLKIAIAPSEKIAAVTNNGQSVQSIQLIDIERQVDFNLKNLSENKWQQKSEQFDFTKEDRVNYAEFNEVIWKAVKGVNSPCPPAVRAAFFMAGK
jgi:hypothetical protein